MHSKKNVPYIVAAVAGAMASFELVASMLAHNGPSCSFILRNTLSIPSTFTEYMDNRLVKRSDEPLWIDDFVVEREDIDYFCKDTGFCWILTIVIYTISVAVLYQRYRGNRMQEMVIAAHAFLGLVLGVILGFKVQDIFTGLFPASVWVALVCMPLHIEENWKEKQGTLRFE